MRESLLYLDATLAAGVFGQTAVIVWFYFGVYRYLRSERDASATVQREAGLTPNHVWMIGLSYLGLVPLTFHPGDTVALAVLAFFLALGNVALYLILERKRRQRKRLR